MMLRFPIMFGFVVSLATGAIAQGSPQPVPPPPASHDYSTDKTDLGTLLDNPDTKTIVEKNIPGLTTNEQIGLARGMTLKAIQQFAPGDVTDKRLAAIDADLSRLRSKK